jgi:hypothetical protein
MRGRANQKSERKEKLSDAQILCNLHRSCASLKEKNTLVAPAAISLKKKKIKLGAIPVQTAQELRLTKRKKT